MDYIRTVTAKKSTGQASFIDLNKAFDTIDHEKLLLKLEIYGLRYPILELFKIFLSGLTQFVSTSCKKQQKSK